MGIWIELGLVLGFIGFGFWQIHDVKKAQAERRAQKLAEQHKIDSGADADATSQQAAADKHR